MIIKIIHQENGMYDVYVDGEWAISRNSPDNVFDYLASITHGSKPTKIEFVDYKH